MKDNDVWRIIFHHRFPSVNRSGIENFRNAHQVIYSNLTKGVYASHTFKGHLDAVRSLAIFDGNLFSGSSDGTIKVWDLKTEQCTATLTDQGEWVNSIVILDGKLFSASEDNTIKNWDLKTGECTATLAGHGGPVLSLAVFDGKLFSGSWDKTIKLWDPETGECTATLTGHENRVTSLAVFDGRLFSGSCDNTIKVWDLKTGECRSTLKGHVDSVWSLSVFDGKLFSTSEDNTIKVWDLKTGECTATLKGHGGVSSLAFFDGMLFSGCYDETIKLWDLETRECTSTLTGHGGWVHSLALFHGKLFSGSSDNTIKVWDFTADDDTIFQEITHSLEGQSEGVSDALERFSRMPKTAKQAIYGKLYEILKPFANEYWGCAEHAFHNQHGQISMPAQKALAIRKYLNDQPRKNNPQLLAHLGIKIEREYSEKLNCRSEHLEKIGLLSVEDVKLICSASPDLMKLDSLEILEVEENFRDNKVKIEAERRKWNLTKLIGEISQLVEDKIEETNACGVILDEAGCPWVSFQQKLKAFQTKLSEIADKSDTAMSIVEAFDSKNYNRLADELNALVEEFHALDVGHQISKLHAYVNQWGILTAWNNLRSKGVQNLSALQPSEQSLQKLFRMGQ